MEARATASTTPRCSSTRTGASAEHRKINELSIASISTRPAKAWGRRTPIARIGVSICADNFRDLWCWASLGRMGAQVLLSPSAWAVQADHDNTKEPYGPFWIDSYSELARLYDMPVIGVSNVGPMEAGPWAGMKCIGASIAMGHDGALVRQLSYGVHAEELAVVEVRITERTAKGTDIGGMLARKGYTGP